jgi:DNA-directed RNA polymerase subunit RPC12/RpoP
MIYKCNYCENTTEENLDELIKYPEKFYSGHKRQGWSVYKTGNKKIYICLKCRNTRKIIP